MTEFRWLIKRDLAEVLRIERLCFQDEALDEETILGILKNRNCIGGVAIDAATNVVGYTIYRLTKNAVEILRMAVHPLDQKQGVGSMMIDRLSSKLSQLVSRRNALICSVSDRETDVLLWLQRRGFVATDCQDDVVQMTFSQNRELCRWRSPAVSELGRG